MIDVIKYPKQGEWGALMRRAATCTADLHDTVAGIIADVASRGDEALREQALKFDHASLEQLQVSTQEFEQAAAQVPQQLKDAIHLAERNIARFHEAQRMRPITVETMPGVTCMQRAVPITSVGLYVPGGNSPLFSTVLMLAVPARIASCRDIVLCTPASADGTVNPAILYAAQATGVTRVFKAGGAGAIAAMAVGTQSIPRVNKIFGPGNRFVMEAKMQVQARGVAIDMPAGPSEVMIIADARASASYVASDFLSQAEHGPDSQSTLLTTSEALAGQLPSVIESMLATLPKRDMMRKSLAHSHVIVLHSDEEMLRFANEYAPEHLIINHRHAMDLAGHVVNAGSVFLGPFSPESVGDYASGTNHTLPTSGYAHAYSGVNLDSFIKKITFQQLTREGLENIGLAVQEMAQAEDLMAHRLAVTVRLNDSKSND